MSANIYRARPIKALHIYYLIYSSPKLSKVAASIIFLFFRWETEA